jgi:hypothetical protein
MKKKLTLMFLALTAGFAFGHGDIELGPNKGRILEFSTNETMHGEVTEKDGKLHIAVLDKAVKVEITKVADGFTLPAPADGEWLIMQYKETADAKAITARLNYNTKKCDPCGQPEWRCACEEKK